jgi:hypothetical protein
MMLRLRHLHGPRRFVRGVGWRNLQRRRVWRLRRPRSALLRSHPQQRSLHGPRHQVQRGNLRQVRRSWIAVLFRFDGGRNLQRRGYDLQ